MAAIKILHSIGYCQITNIVTGQDWKENCYLICQVLSGEQVLVDPGDDAETILRAILDNGGRLDYILLTHAHHDHVGAVAEICRRFNLSCNVHKDDARLLRHAPMYAYRFSGKKIEQPEPVRIFDKQVEFGFGNAKIKVIHTPGHTSGSVCYYLDGYVFTGDTLLRQHIGRTDLPGGDMTHLQDSISQLLENLPAETRLFPGHGDPWTVAEAREWWSCAALSHSIVHKGA